METLAHHKEVVERYIVLMEMLQSEFAIKKKELNKKIVELSTNSLQEQAEKTDFPSDYFDNLTKIKLEFKKIESDEKVQIDELMTNYSEEIDNHNQCDVEVSFTVESCNDEPRKGPRKVMYIFSAQLCDFLGKPKGTKSAHSEISRFIWSYIEKHNLKDIHDERKINPDDKLWSLLKCNKSEIITFSNIQRHLSHHFKRIN